LRSATKPAPAPPPGDPPPSSPNHAPPPGPQQPPSNVITVVPPSPGNTTNTGPGPTASTRSTSSSPSLQVRFAPARPVPGHADRFGRRPHRRVDQVGDVGSAERALAVARQHAQVCTVRGISQEIEYWR
jgi:hypothetical protein